MVTILSIIITMTWQVLFKIAHNDLRDRAVFDANGVEIPTGYRRKMLAMLPVYALVDCGC